MDGTELSGAIRDIFWFEKINISVKMSRKKDWKMYDKKEQEPSKKILYGSFKGCTLNACRFLCYSSVDFNNLSKIPNCAQQLLDKLWDFLATMATTGTEESARDIKTKKTNGRL